MTYIIIRWRRLLGILDFLEVLEISFGSLRFREYFSKHLEFFEFSRILKISRDFSRNLRDFWGDLLL